MAIRYSAEQKTFLLETRHTSYVMKVSGCGDLLHLYYGDRIPDENLDYLICQMDRGFSPNPDEAGNDRTYSRDFLPQEFSTNGVGDYRTSSIQVVNSDGSQMFAGSFDGYEIQDGKYRLQGMPSLWTPEGERADTLRIRLKDKVSGAAAELLYGVLEEQDIITRSVRLINEGTGELMLQKLMSATLDFSDSAYDLITFDGRHLMERELTRTPIRSGIQSVGSMRGTSSHQHNPFAILCEPAAGEDRGRCYGCSLVYSGNFLIEAEQDQYRQLRFSAGIHPEHFSFLLEPGDSFEAPEAVLAYSPAGLTGLSHLYHNVYRRCLCRSPYAAQSRPVLLNSWEAAYFDFDEEKLLRIAKGAADMGAELFVLDDGWFGARDDDNSSLGDWQENKTKLKGDLCSLSERVHALGLKFGLWIEPEMISERSRLYEAHPDWCLKAPGRPSTRGRNQLVLDLSREDVCQYLIETFCGILDRAQIEYVKWDVNRSLSDVWSALLPSRRQGEVFHRYILGLYHVMDQVILTHPEILFCGCSGGGGRFDPAMLYYQPQIWCSDNTDAKARLKIQYGTSFCYPVCTLEAHVSVCPNHQTGRSVPMDTRGIVAMDGILGYELDSTKLSAEEKEECRRQIQFYKTHYQLIAEGDYYRLTSPYEDGRFTAWQHVSRDRREALVSLVMTDREGNDAQRFLRLKGLRADAFYRVSGYDRVFSGALLMSAGLPVPLTLNEYEGIQYSLRMDGDGDD